MPWFHPAKLYFILGGETYCDELNKMRRYVFDEYTCRDTFNEILFVNFSMKIVYSLSLLRSIEIPFFVYLFRNYSPFYAVSFMSLFDFLSFSSPSLSPSFQLFHVSHTIYFILGKCCRQTQRRNAAFYGIRSSGLRLRAVWRSNDVFNVPSWEGEGGNSQQLDSKKRIRGPRLIFSSVSRWRTRSDNSFPSTLFR